MKALRPSDALTVLAAAFCLASVAAAAEPPTPRLFDFPALEKLAADGLEPRGDGTYEVWVWGKGPELAITIGQSEFKVEARRFGWHHAGQVDLQAGQRLHVSYPTSDKLDDLTNIPGYLALTTDSEFDPKRRALGYVRTLYDGGRFRPSRTKAQWLERKESLRRQILVAAGLWPMPPRRPLHTQLYGRQVRDGYTIEKVVLETFPGFYLSGNLYRPASWVPTQREPDDVMARKKAWEKNRQADKRPGILCPHGHWRYGRFEPEVQRRCKQLARMGAVVFSYDMVGRGDSTPFGHAFLDPQIELLGFSLMGLQTWNSIRALDFLSGLPDVDTERIACTGSSGGGTQTFILSALDDRVKVSAPVVMVSQDMQGGCSCENASGLRIGTDNSEFAAMFAPKPQVLVGAHDWTWEFMTKGFPEVRATYSLFGAEDRVEAEVFDFPHNYNRTSRERVYAFFAKWLFDIDPALSKELPTEPETKETLTTWDAENPRPEEALDASGLKGYLASLVAEQAEQFRPTSPEQWAVTRQELATSLGYRLASGLPGIKKQVIEMTESTDVDGYRVVRLRLGAEPSPRLAAAQCLPTTGRPKAGTLLVHPQGTGALLAADEPTRALVRELVGQGHLVLAIDLYPGDKNSSPFLQIAPKEIRHFTCYNRSVPAERVRDIVVALVYLKRRVGERPVNLVGLGSAGPLCLVARTQAPQLARTVIDADQFEYLPDAQSPANQLLPGIVRLGGLRAVSCLVAPGRLLLHNTGDALDTSWVEAAYRLAEAPRKLTVLPEQANMERIVAELGG